MACGVKRFVMISTDKAVNPTNIMGATKRLAEMTIEALNARGLTEFTAVRFGNVLGSHGSVVPLFERQIRAGGPVTITHPEIIRYFMTIPEAASLVLQAASIAKGGELFVLDMGQPVRIRELAERMIQLYAAQGGSRNIEIVYTGLRPGEKLYEELLMDDENIVRTGLDKIFIAKPEVVTEETLARVMNTLRVCLETGADMRACLHGGGQRAPLAFWGVKTWAGEWINKALQGRGYAQFRTFAKFLLGNIRCDMLYCYPASRKEESRIG